MGKKTSKKLFAMLLAIVLFVTAIPYTSNGVVAKAETEMTFEEWADSVDSEKHILDMNDFATKLYENKTYIESNPYFYFQNIQASQNSTKTFEDGLSFYEMASFKTTNTSKNPSQIGFSVQDEKFATVKIYLTTQIHMNTCYGLFKVVDEGEDILVKRIEQYGFDVMPEYIYNIESGDYYIAKLEGSNTMTLYRIEVTEYDDVYNYSVGNWDDVSAPIVNFTIPYGDRMEIFYDAMIGDGYGDHVEVEIYDSDDQLYKTWKSKSNYHMTVKMMDSDKYTIKLKLVSSSGDVLYATEDKVCDFSYQLGTPKILTVYNSGGGMVNVDFTEVREATSYYVEYREEGASDWEFGDYVKSGRAKIYGLDIGKTYAIRVVANRKNEHETSEHKLIIVSNDASIVWNQGAGGNAIKDTDPTFVGQVGVDEFVNISVGNKKGKVTKNGRDGFASTYVKLNEENDFSLSFDAKVNSWLEDGGSSGFGAYILDANIAETGGFDNGIIIGAQDTNLKSQENPDGVTSQRDGIGIIFKEGITKETCNDTSSPEGFETSHITLEDRFPNDTNIIGNSTNADIAHKEDGLTDFHFDIRKLGSVYTVTYKPLDDSNYENSYVIDYGDKLKQIDSEYIYIGLFVARYFDVTFSNIDFRVLSNADYTEVDAAITKANGLNKDAYMSFVGVDKAINNVVRGIKVNEQGLVDLMAKNINDAINALVLKPVSTEENGVITTVETTEIIKGGEKITVGEESHIEIKNEPDANAIQSAIVATNDNELINKLLSSSEKAIAAQDGTHVSFGLKLVNRGNEVSDLETKVIAKELTGTAYVGAFVDIQVEKTIGNKKVPVATTNDKIKISLEVPASLASKINVDGATYQVARNHDGVVEMINAVYKAATNTLEFETDRFSTYAITLPEDTTGGNEDNPNVKFVSHSLTLGGEIAVNFYVSIPEEVRAGSYMTFNVSGIDGKTETVNFSDAVLTDAALNKYKFNVSVNALQMADTITATFNYGAGKSITKEYSVKAYVETAMERSDDVKLKTLLKAMADYGYYAQKYFSVKNGWVLGVDHKEMMHYSDDIDISNILSEFAYRDENKIDGIRISQSLRLDSKTELVNRIYVTAGYGKAPSVVVKDKNGNIVDAQLEIDNDATLGADEVAAYKLVIQDINAHMLGDEYQLIIDGTMTRYESVLSYANLVLKNSVDSELKQAVVALYNYYNAAKEYKNK